MLGLPDHRDVNAGRGQVQSSGTAMVTVSCGNKNYSLFPYRVCTLLVFLPARADKDHTMSLQMCTDSSERDGAFASL